MAAAYEVATKKVEPLKKRLVAEGFAAALSRQPVPNAPRRTITGAEEAHVLALSWRQPPAGQERWTLRRLAATMVEWESVASVSSETLRRP